MEEALKKLPIDSLHIIRPSLLLGNRSEFRHGERIAKIIMTRFSFLIPKNYRAIHAEKVARAMILPSEQGRPWYSYPRIRGTGIGAQLICSSFHL